MSGANPSLVSVMKKQGNPRPRHPPSKAPSSFLPPFYSFSVLPLVILEPTSPYISWDTFNSRIQHFRAARFNRESLKPTFYQYLCLITTFLSEFKKKVLFTKIKNISPVLLLNNKFCSKYIFSYLKHHYSESKNCI